MIGKDNIVQVNLPGLVLIPEKVPIGAVDRIEGKPCEVHGQEV